MAGQLSSDDRIMTTHGFAKILCSGRLFGGDLGRVGFKFIRDMLVGIQRTRSVNLTDIATENVFVEAQNCSNTIFVDILLWKDSKLYKERMRGKMEEQVS